MTLTEAEKTMIKAAGLTEADFTGGKGENPEPGDSELEKRVATVEETVEAVKIILMGEDKS